MSVTNYDGRLEAMADSIKAMYVNLAKVENTYHDSVENVYSKLLPNKYMDFLRIKKIGGKTLLWNQLNSNSSSTSTVADVTFTNNGDGSWTINGTSSSGVFVSKSLCSINLIAGHKYLNIGCPSGGSATTYYTSFSGNGADFGSGRIYTPGASATVTYAFNFNAGTSFDNVTIYPQVFDLTLMFGAGKEPATVAEFVQMFPSWYDYEPGVLMSAGVVSVISKDSDDATLETFSIPEDISTMEGYGLSCPGAYNYIDFETKKFVQAVGSRAYEAGDESDSTVITDGTRTNYELDTPLEFDVDLPDDIITKVTPAGSLTFKNQLDDDYKIPVPVQLEYIGV